MASNVIEEVVQGIKNLDITQSNRGRPILVYQNFEYKIETSNPNTKKTIWRCNNTNGTCKGRLWSFGGLEKEQIDNLRIEMKIAVHNHAACPALIEIRKHIVELKVDHIKIIT